MGTASHPHQPFLHTLSLFHPASATYHLASRNASVILATYRRDVGDQLFFARTIASSKAIAVASYAADSTGNDT